MTSDMEVIVGADGVARCIYDEALDLRELGKLQITRASHVEPDAEGYWWADMRPVGGPVLGPYGSRSKALGAERQWLMVHPAGLRPSDLRPIPVQRPSTPSALGLCLYRNSLRHQQKMHDCPKRTPRRQP
jgi:hypothetical protein